MNREERMKLLTRIYST